MSIVNLSNEWETKKLGDILSMQKGKNPISTYSEQRTGSLPYVDIKTFERGIVDSYTDGEKCLSCEEGDLLIVCDGSRSGLIGRAKKGFVGSTLAKISAIGLETNFLAYFLQSKYQKLNTNVKGTGTPHVDPALLKSFVIPVLPLPEQEHIVAKIEELFSELDKGVETLQKTKSQLKVYRQAVLKDAFEGKLSNSNTLNWEVMKARKVVKDEKYSFTIGPFGSDLKVSDYSNNGIPLVFVRDIRNGFSSKVHKYISEDKAEKLKAHSVSYGDLLITKMGDPPGDCYIYPFSKQGIITSDCIKMKINENVGITKFIMYYILSPLGRRQISLMTKGVAQKKVSLERFEEFLFSIPTRYEQGIIVSEIETRLSVCEKIEQIVDDALQKAESLRQSILKIAFEGKLV